MPKIKLIVDGGSMSAGPAVAQQLGPMGINMGKVISDVNAATASMKGVKVPVELDVDPNTKTYEIVVFSPPVAELIKKELKIDKGSGTPHSLKVGNIAIETLIGIAKTKSSDLLCRNLKSSLKTVVGTCVSLGVLIDNKSPIQIISEIDSGEHDKIINEELTTPSEEKQNDIQKFWTELKAKQDKDLKAAQAAAAAAEEAAKEAAVDKPAAGAAEKPAAAAAKPAEKKK